MITLKQAIAILLVLIPTLVFWIAAIIYNDNPPTLPTDETRTELATEGYCIIITDNVYCFYKGVDLTLIELQEAIEVEADGKLGAKTIQRVLDRNRTEINYVQREILK